jgi:arginase family enzyme
LERFEIELFDFTKLGPSVRLWMNKYDSGVLRAFLAKQPKNHITFLGSGDFHHVSGLLIEQFSEPISVIVFDNHPDWDTLPPHLGCGSWVSYILRRPNIREVVIFGPSSQDLSGFWIQTANFSAIKSGRIRIYPYAHRPTRIFFAGGLMNPSLEVEKVPLSQMIHWQQLKGRDLMEFIPWVLSSLPTKKVYLSVDKDCLRHQYALTNWEEGKLHISELTSILRWIRKNLDVVGADIAGEYSYPNVSGMIKNFCSRLDHPREYTAKDKFTEFINNTNEHTNTRLLETLL